MIDIQLFDFALNLLQAIIWQYQNAANLQGLITAKNTWYEENQTQFWEDWITNVFDLDTADEFGIAVWSIILGLPSFVNQPPDMTSPVFGFDLDTYANFDNGILANSNGQSVVLPIETQRLGLKFRYFQLCSSGTVPEINRFLAFLFGPKMAWLRDFGNMTQQYVFNFPVTWDLAFLFNNFDVLPRPAGVGSSWIDATIPCFGFDSGHLNFDRGILGG